MPHRRYWVTIHMPSDRYGKFASPSAKKRMPGALPSAAFSGSRREAITSRGASTKSGSASHEAASSRCAGTSR